MELLVNRRNVVSIEDQGFTSVAATWTRNGVEMGAINTPVSPSNGRWSITLPYQTIESTIQVFWTIQMTPEGTVLRTDTYDVVTPYLYISEIKAMDSSIDDSEATKLESVVRHIINAYTGQTFGMKTGSHTVKGTGYTYLPLPERLIALTDILGFRYGADVSLGGGGWYLSSDDTRGFLPPVRADYDGLNSGSHLEVPIRIPTWASRIGNVFYANEQYTVQGTWGWQNVPQQVREAALLLANDYACGDNVYRDRFLTSMTAADWRIQFNSRAFDGTGNARADQLLSGFVLSRGWAVI